MLSKNTLKYLTSLAQKKYRDRHGVFVAEGPKLIKDLHSAGLELQQLFTTSEDAFQGFEFELINAKELKKISNQKSPNTALAIFKKKQANQLVQDGLILALDNIQDPGNLGTIIRLCDWFGVKHLVCTKDTADCYNPKVVQASMGALARVEIHYMEDFANWLSNAKMPIYGGFMQGQNVYNEQLQEDAILIMGNEGNGISETVEALVQTRLSIPNFGDNEGESLNVATATAVLLSEFRRSTGK